MPTGSVDLFMIIFGEDICVAIVSATFTTYLRSADPSSSGGVPTAINYSSPKLTPNSGSVVKCKRPEAKFSSTIGVRPGS